MIGDWLARNISGRGAIRHIQPSNRESGESGEWDQKALFPLEGGRPRPQALFPLEGESIF